ncbi:unnamed protein product [Miscanthus lutarioriparius]|uniref:Uncharacterized protein n=1 Tax=Miscanthus lutarioriparius TaxID=422564 RepID=A0A811SJP8_9POAL|nr:unnamed protein product [Miscanthus lutarioriparius]
MVLGLDCFGFMARKALESSKKQEAGDARKKKDASEEAASREASCLEGLSRYNYILHVQEVKGGIHNQNSSIKMVLGLDCFGFMARKAPESSKQQEAEDARKKKDATEEAASQEASENKGEKAVEMNNVSPQDQGPPCESLHSPFLPTTI